MGCSARIARYPAKITHFFENLQILPVYTILFTTSSIVCESFIRGLSIGFQRVAKPSALATIDGLNGLRPLSASLGHVAGGRGTLWAKIPAVASVRSRIADAKKQVALVYKKAIQLKGTSAILATQRTH